MEADGQHEDCFAEWLHWIPIKIAKNAQKVLEAPIIEEELIGGVQALVKGKVQDQMGSRLVSSRHIGVLCNDFTTMVNEFLGRGHFPNIVIHGLIALLFKDNDKLKVMNWQPSTLLNTTYKIFGKRLQKELQPLLVEVIYSDQTAFLPLGYILENILLTHESIQ